MDKIQELQGHNMKTVDDGNTVVSTKLIKDAIAYLDDTGRTGAEEVAQKLRDILEFDKIAFGNSFVEVIKDKDGNTTSVTRVHPLEIENPCFNRMDIYSPSGTKVIFDSLGGYPGDKEFAKKYLVLDNTYTVLFVDIGNFSSEVYLKEFPNIPFNTVLFKAINEEELYKV